MLNVLKLWIFDIWFSITPYGEDCKNAKCNPKCKKECAGFFTKVEFFSFVNDNSLFYWSNILFTLDEHQRHFVENCANYYFCKFEKRVFHFQVVLHTLAKISSDEMLAFSRMNFSE